MKKLWKWDDFCRESSQYDEQMICGDHYPKLRMKWQSQRLQQTHLATPHPPSEYQDASGYFYR